LCTQKPARNLRTVQVFSEIRLLTVSIQEEVITDAIAKVPKVQTTPFIFY